MTDLNRPDSSNLSAFLATNGAIVQPNTVMSGGQLTVLGCTLTANTTYYVPFGAAHSPVPAEVPLVAFQARWDNTAALAITLEDTLFPATMQSRDPRGPAQLSDVDVTPGFWLTEQPPNSYVTVVGGTFQPSTFTITSSGNAAGGCIIHLGNVGSPRLRAKIAVGATGGVVRFAVWGKAAA